MVALNLQKHDRCNYINIESILYNPHIGFLTHDMEIEIIVERQK